ncbi:MAG: NADH-quinone oxidoreductase subunit A [Caldilineae bacterium]|nr:NADH-quinone oxidoreductase subunit A [Chloroflexota bacterium]MCB9176491.1 NADH-quinone oxidoreductase subunit A [Caldilineae bacterium]
MSAAYLPLLILGLMGLGLGLAVYALTFLIGPRKPSPVKDSTYESGLSPIGASRRRIPVRFYLIATLFILFDIEVIYLFPYASRFQSLARPVAEGGMGPAALASVGLFVGVLLLGFVYVWRKGALEWE